MKPLRDCHLRTHQTLRGHTRIFARAYYLRPNNASHVAVGSTMCHAETKSARPFIAPSPEPQWGLTLIEPLRPYYLGSGRRSRSNGRQLSIPSTSRTLAARRGEKLAGRSERSFRQCPISANSIASQLVKNGAHRTGIASPPGWSTRSCTTYGRSQHVKVTASLNPLGRRSLLLPSDA